MKRKMTPELKKEIDQKHLLLSQVCDLIDVITIESVANGAIAANHLSWLYYELDIHKKSKEYADIYTAIYMRVVGPKSQYNHQEQLTFLKIID